MSLVELLTRLAKAKAAASLDELTELLKVALSKCWDSQARDFLSTLVDFTALGDALDEADVKHIAGLAEGFLGQGLEAAARRPVLSVLGDAYALGGKAAAVDFSLKAPDLASLDALQHWGLLSVGRTYDRFVADDMRRAMEGFFRTGATRRQLAEGLEILLHDRETPKVHGYFALLADHLATKTAELGRVSGYEEAGIEAVEIVARMDERTTPICRSLHGRVIPLAAIGAQRDRIIAAAAAGDMEAMKRAQPMLSGPLEQEIALTRRTGDIVKRGIGLPPYHFRCRTVTVAHFEPVSYPRKAAQWAIDGEVPRKALPSLVDAARKARWGTHKALWDRRQGGDGREHPTFFVHAMKHGVRNGLSPSEYNQGAIDLIRRSGRDAWLVVVNKEHPYPVLYFRDPKSEEFAVVNLEGGQIATYHRLSNDRFVKRLARAEVALELPMRGIAKWTRRFSG